MGEAFVKHAQHNIHGHQRSQYQERLSTAGFAEVARIAIEAAANSLRHMQLLTRPLNIGGGHLKRYIGQEIERTRRRWNGLRVKHRQWRKAALVVDHGG